MFSFSAIALAIAPLALAAAFAYRWRPRSFIAAATRTWPIAALGLYELSATTLGVTPLHAFEGISMPLAILAVQAIRHSRWQRLRFRRLIASLAIAAATLPATAYALNFARSDVAPNPGNANFIAGDERRALDYLAADREPGGVLTRFYLGSVVPGATGRRTWIGTCVWSTPHCLRRTALAEQLFGGSLGPRTARTFVLGTGARFVLADCRSRADLARLLAPIIRSVRRYGCARYPELGLRTHRRLLRSVRRHRPARARLGFTFAMLIIGVEIRMLSIPVLRSGAGIIAVSVLGGALVYVVNRG